MHNIRKHISYANVMATVATCIALGGTSYAALSLPRNSVTSKQLKPGSVKSSDIKNGTVSARDLKRGLLPANTAASSVPGPAGPAGARGPAGANGTNGTDGADGTVGEVRLVRADLAVADGNFGAVEMTCPEGTRALGGGSSVQETGANDIKLLVSRPGPGSHVPLDGETFDTWRVGYRNETGGAPTANIRGWAICGEIPPAR